MGAIYNLLKHWGAGGGNIDQVFSRAEQDAVENVWIQREGGREGQKVGEDWILHGFIIFTLAKYYCGD